MAKKSLEIEMKIAADVSELKKAQMEINDFQRRMQTTFNQIRSGLTLNIGAGIGNRLAQIPSLINSSISAYARQEGAEANLAAAIRATGAQAKDAAESLKALASNLQAITAYGDETVLEMEALAVSFGVPADKMRECMEGAIGLSKAFKVDLKMATAMAAEALQGKTLRLNSYIPALKNATSDAERLSLAQMAMVRGFSQAKAETETLEGAVRQCSNIWGDNAEIVGKSLAPAYRAFIEIVTSLGKFLNENPRIIAVATRGFIAMAAAMSVAPIAKYLNAQKSLAAQLNVLRLRQSAYLIAAASTRSLSVAVKGLAAAFGPVGLAMLVPPISFTVWQNYYFGNAIGNFPCARDCACNPSPQAFNFGENRAAAFGISESADTERGFFENFGRAFARGSSAGGKSGHHRAGFRPKGRGARRKARVRTVQQKTNRRASGKGEKAG